MIAYIPAAVCGILSAALIRSGLPSFFFLVPMGFMAYGYGPASARTSAGIAVLGNGVVSLGTSLFLGRAFSWTDTLYFTLMLSVYTCILAPPVRRIGPFPLTLPYRLIGGSFIGALLFLLVMETTQGSFGEFLLAQGKLLSSIYIASAGTDVVQRSILEQYVTPERVAEVLAAVLLRGGGFASCLLVFLASRQISLLAVRLIRRVGTPEQISRFHTPS